MLLDVQCVILRKTKVIKVQEASGSLSSLEIKIPLSQIHLVDPLLF